MTPSAPRTKSVETPAGTTARGPIPSLRSAARPRRGRPESRGSRPRPSARAVPGCGAARRTRRSTGRGRPAQGRARSCPSISSLRASGIRCPRTARRLVRARESSRDRAPVSQSIATAPAIRALEVVLGLGVEQAVLGLDAGVRLAHVCRRRLGAAGARISVPTTRGGLQRASSTSRRLLNAPRSTATQSPTRRPASSVTMVTVDLPSMRIV